MTEFLEFAEFIGVFVALFVVCVVAVIWVTSPQCGCNHSYERIDDCNDKKMILVCRRCGKIKKLRK